LKDRKEKSKKQLTRPFAAKPKSLTSKGVKERKPIIEQK